MSQCVVIADDLTGANATGVLLKKMNYEAYTVMNTERIRMQPLFLVGFLAVNLGGLRLCPVSHG